MFGWFDPEWKKAFNRIQFTEIFDAFEEEKPRIDIVDWDMYAEEGARKMFDTYIDTDRRYLKVFKNPASLDDFDLDHCLLEMVQSYMRMVMLSFDGVRFDEKRLCMTVGMLILMIDCISRSTYKINYEHLQNFKTFKRLKHCKAKELIKITKRKEVA